MPTKRAEWKNFSRRVHKNRKLRTHLTRGMLLRKRLPCVLAASGIVYLENANRLFSSRLTYPEVFLFLFIYPLTPPLTHSLIQSHSYPRRYIVSAPFIFSCPCRKLSPHLHSFPPLSITYTRKFMSGPGRAVHSIFRFPFFIERDTFCSLYGHCGRLRSGMIAMQNTGECVSTFQRFIIRCQFDYCTTRRSANMLLGWERIHFAGYCLEGLFRGGRR